MHTAEVTNVGTGILAKATNYYTKGGAKKNAKAILALSVSVTCSAV